MYWNNPNNIEALFEEEIRDKKRTARGSFHNITHRGGGKKGAKLKTQVDYLTGKAKREYMKGSTIVEYNMYTDINNCPSLEKLREIDATTAHNILVEVRKHNTINVIREYLGTSGYMLYKIFDEFNIEYEKRGTKEEQQKKKLDYLNSPDYVPKRKYHRKDEEVEEVKNEIAVKDEYIEIPDVIPEKIDEEEFQLKYNKKSVSGAEPKESFRFYGYSL